MGAVNGESGGRREWSAIGLTAGAASAGKDKVKDPREDASSSFDQCDVVTATAGHKGRRVIVHSVKVASPNVSPSASMSLYINTTGKPKQGGKPKKDGWMAFGPACGDGTDSAPGKGPVFSTAFTPVFKAHKTKP